MCKNTAKFNSQARTNREVHHRHYQSPGVLKKKNQCQWNIQLLSSSSIGWKGRTNAFFPLDRMAKILPFHDHVERTCS